MLLKTFKVLLMLGTAGVSWREQECEFQRPEWGECHPTSSAFSHTAAVRISEMAYPDLPVESVICVQHKYIRSIARYGMHFCPFLGTDCDVSSQEQDCSDDADVLLEEVTG